MPERNTELLQRVMQHINDHPEQHNQERYWNDCGTPSCFAGWALHFSGITIQALRRSPLTTGEYAGDILGLTDDERSTLFYAENTRPMLELMVKDLVNGDELRDVDDYEGEAGV